MSAESDIRRGAGAGPLEWALSAFDGTLGASRRLRMPRLLLYGTLAVLPVFGVWAVHAEVERVVRSHGRVVPSGKPQLVQHLEGGIVLEIQVREGDRVQRGDPLVVVSDLVANASRDEKQQRIDGLLARIARLRAEAEGQGTYQPPRELGRDRVEVRNEAEAFLARQNRLQQSIAVFQQQSKQKREEIAEQAARGQALGAEHAVARQQLAIVQEMVSRKAGSQQELLDAQARVQRLNTQIAETESAVPRLNAAVSELAARVAEVQAQFRSEARIALSEAEVELRRLREDLKTDEDRVHRTVVRAPESGTVNKLNANTVGGVVRPGEVLLELTPEDRVVVVETRASPADRGAMTVGQQALLRVAAYDYTTYGTLSAQVVEISPDSLPDERGDRYFRAVLHVDAESLRAFGRTLSPGMTLSADIVTGRRTVAQYLLSPVKGLASTALREHR